MHPLKKAITAKIRLSFSCRPQDLEKMKKAERIAAAAAYDKAIADINAKADAQRKYNVGPQRARPRQFLL